MSLFFEDKEQKRFGICHGKHGLGLVHAGGQDYAACFAGSDVRQKELGGYRLLGAFNHSSPYLLNVKEGSESSNQMSDLQLVQEIENLVSPARWSVHKS